MLYIYKIDSIEIVDEPVDDIFEHNGIPLFHIIVKNVHFTADMTTEKEFTDQYEFGWPIYIQNTKEWGFCENEYSLYDWNDVAETLATRKLERHLFIRISFNNKPSEGMCFAFLNQYDKRLTNEEIIKAVDNNISSNSVSKYIIGEDNKLHYDKGSIDSVIK